MLLDGAAMENLRRSHVAVIGLGGVGSYAAEALVRSGAGKITLCDFDRVSYTNLNRQLCALHSTLGMYKADVLAARALDINPEVRVRPLCLRYDKTTREAFFDGGYDYIVDAIDIVTGKIDLIEQSLNEDRSYPRPAQATGQTPLCFASEISQKPSSIRLPGSYAGNCAPGASCITPCSGARRRRLFRCRFRRRPPDGAACPQASPGSPPARG